MTLPVNAAVTESSRLSVITRWKSSGHVVLSPISERSPLTWLKYFWPHWAQSFQVTRAKNSFSEVNRDVEEWVLSRLSLCSWHDKTNQPKSNIFTIMVYSLCCTSDKRIANTKTTDIYPFTSCFSLNVSQKFPTLLTSKRTICHLIW